MIIQDFHTFLLLVSCDFYFRIILLILGADLAFFQTFTAIHRRELTFLERLENLPVGILRFERFLERLRLFCCVAAQTIISDWPNNNLLFLITTSKTKKKIDIQNANQEIF
jgi:hypothetical protein